MATQSTQGSKPSVSKLCWVTAAIRRFLLTIAGGTIFSTRELLTLGSRSAIDSALSRLVAAGAIVRLASGLYMKFKASDPNWRPGTEAIIQAKLLAFRRIGVAASETLSKFDVELKTADGRSRQEAQSKDESDSSMAPNAIKPAEAINETASQNSQSTVVYEITGNRSKFRLFNGILVQVTSMANRKLDLAQSVIGAKLKNLWKSVDCLCEDSARKFLGGLGREERSDVKALLPLLPRKLSDLLGAPWNHRQEVLPVSSLFDDNPAVGSRTVEWFSLSAISRSRAHRGMMRPPPVVELNF